MTAKRKETRRQFATSPTFAPFVRRGTEGVCSACQKPIRAHYGHRNTWLGCTGKVADNATFMLVPQTAARAADRGHAVTAPRPHFVYTVKDRRRRTLPERFTEAIRDAYTALLKVSEPQTAERAATLAKRPTEANRRCLNWLTRRGWVRKAVGA